MVATIRARPNVSGRPHVITFPRMWAVLWRVAIAGVVAGAILGSGWFAVGLMRYRASPDYDRAENAKNWKANMTQACRDARDVARKHPRPTSDAEFERFKRIDPYWAHAKSWRISPSFQAMQDETFGKNFSKCQ